VVLELSPAQFWWKCQGSRLVGYVVGTSVAEGQETL
jgi:hypothetical protein